MARASFGQALRGLMNRRLGVMLFLGFASGLPLELTGGTLQLWLADEGVDMSVLALLALVPGAPNAEQLPRISEVAGIPLEVIALFTLVGLPYILKMLWAPLMDRYVPPLLGRRRGWMILTQLALIAGLLGMATASPRDGAMALAVLALFVAFASASQDIVIDAYSTDVLHGEERGVGAALKVFGYRLAMLVAGGVAAVLGEVSGWDVAYIAMAGFMGLGVLTTLLSPPPERVAQAPRTLAEALVEPLREFLTRDAALWLLLLVVLYKFGDAFASSLFSAFLRRELHFTPAEIGVVRKTVGFISVAGGMFVGGILMVRLGLYKSLVVFGVLMAASNAFFMILSEVGHDYPLMVAGVIIENVTGGMGTAALVALLMALCDQRYTATQYALLSALASLARVLIGPAAGPMVETVGWTTFFLVTTLVAVPTLAILWMLRSNLRRLDAT